MHSFRQALRTSTRIIAMVLLLILFTATLQRSSQLFAQGYAEVFAGSLTAVGSGSVAWGDYNNDGLLDILMTGHDGSQGVSKIYQNTGSGFTEVFAGSLTPVYQGSAAWGDYDHDGDSDIVLGGTNGPAYFAKIYNNTGSGFTEVFAGSLPTFYFGSVAWGDYDNDGDLDILLTGTGDGFAKISKIFQNTGSGFSEVYPGSLTPVTNSSAVWGDYDHDGDLDILLTGYDGSANVSKIYQNTGSGFTEVFAGSLIGVASSSVAWGDYDHDGDLDILLTGGTGTINVSKIYQNTGSGFTEAFAGSLTGIYVGSAKWGDYDHDGNLDILLTGATASGSISKVYKNTGNGFTQVFAGELTGVINASADWGDFDNDGDLDIVLNGDSNGGKVSKMYKNMPKHLIFFGAYDHGSVTSNPPTPISGDPVYVEYGTPVNATATPDPRYRFTGWTALNGFYYGVPDGYENYNPVYFNTDDKDRVIYANFELLPPPLRTETYEHWATAVDAKGKLASIKRKADKVFFKFNIAADSTGILSLDFGASTNGSITWGKTKLDTLATFTNVKKYKDTLVVNQGDTIQIEGVTAKGKTIAVKYAWGEKGKAVTLKDPSLYKVNRTGLPMPNLHNVGDELFPKGFGQTSAYFTNGLLVGVPQGPKGGNSVKLAKYADVLASMVTVVKKKAVYHADTDVFYDARCLDTLDGTKRKPIDKQLKSLSPTKQNNKLFAEVLTLKLNIAASATEKFPAGFGQLTFDDGGTFAGLMVDSIVTKADSMLSCLPISLPATFFDIYWTVRMLNEAFAPFEPSIDTLSFGSKTKLTGVRTVYDVWYLHPTAGVAPRIVQSFDAVETAVPEAFTLNQNYPNPFNPTTTIGFQLPENGLVTLTIYDMLGREVSTLIDHQDFDGGEYEFPFDGSSLTSGVYYYRINVESVGENGIQHTFTNVKRMLMIK